MIPKVAVALTFPPDCTRKSGAALGTTLGSDPDLVGDSMDEMTGVP